METSLLGSLRVRRLVKESGPAGRGKALGARPLTCVFLHGFGAPGDDLVGLADGIDVPQNTTFVFPEAPHSLQDFLFEPLYGDARAWWMIDMGAMERAIVRGELRDLRGQVPDGLAEARRAVMSMLDALAVEEADKPEEARGRLVLGGFSQGAMLSLDVALRARELPLAGIVLLSGTLIAEQQWSPLFAGRRGARVFQSHGEQDPILPFSIATTLRDRLIEAGLDVTFDPFQGPHTIPPATLARLGAWLHALA